MAEQGDQSLFDLFAHHVFPTAGLDVHVLPLEPDDVQQQPLGEPVLAHDRNRRGRVRGR